MVAERKREDLVFIGTPVLKKDKNLPCLDVGFLPRGNNKDRTVKIRRRVYGRQVIGHNVYRVKVKRTFKNKQRKPTESNIGTKVRFLQLTVHDKEKVVTQGPRFFSRPCISP